MHDQNNTNILLALVMNVALHTHTHTLTYAIICVAACILAFRINNYNKNKHQLHMLACGKRQTFAPKKIKNKNKSNNSINILRYSNLAFVHVCVGEFQ